MIPQQLEQALDEVSAAHLVASYGAKQRVEVVGTLTDEQAERLEYQWNFWARPDQVMPPGTDWQTWLLLAGRGFGKTRCGAEFVKAQACGSTPLGCGSARHIALVAETAADARDVMVEGPSGILACHHKDFRPLYESSKRRLTWPNGAIATLYNAVEPDQLRGPNHDLAWGDELAKWRYARETWDQLAFGLRLGDNPRVVVTTTPKPVPVLKEIIADEQTVITRGSTYANQANLAPSFYKYVTRKYGGTRLGRQELLAELIDQAEHALWTREVLERNRIMPDWTNRANTPQLEPDWYMRVVVAIDPSVTAKATSNECGIVVCGLGPDGFGYVLDDRSGVMSPDKWGREAIFLYDKWRADKVVGETNNGGEMVGMTVRQAAINMRLNGERMHANVHFGEVHASRGKYARAEPVAALSEQDRIKLLGAFPDLEDQLASWEPLSGDESPDRLDAMVWGFTELMLGYSQVNIGMPGGVRKDGTDEEHRGKKQTSHPGFARGARPEEIG